MEDGMSDPYPVRALAPLRWTKELPTQPGWYWDRWPLMPEQVSISRITRTPGSRSLHLVENGPLELYRGREWAGPIPMPEETS